MKSKRSYIRRDWNRVMEEYSDSGLSVEEYCKHTNINKYLFLRWQQKLVGKHAEEVVPSKYSSVEFIQLPVVPNPSLAIRFPGDIEVLVPKHFDADFLQSLVIQLKEALC